jgi:hypothetical protein
VKPQPLEQPPSYVEATPEQWEAAKISVARKQKTNFFAFGAPFRRSALRSALNSGAWIRPEIAVEFRSTIDAIGYRPRALPPADPVGDAKRAQARADYHAAQAKPPSRFVSTAQARAILGPIGFAHFSGTPEGRELQRRENGNAETLYHGRG